MTSRLASLAASVARSLVASLLAFGGILSAGTGTLRADEKCMVIEDFSKTTIGEFPSGWKARKDSGKGVYKVVDVGGKRALRADAKDIGVQAGKEFAWDLHEYPILAWAWKPVLFPEGADERGKKNDSAVAVYAVFPHSQVSVKSLKYIWSEKVPQGTHIPQSGGNTQGVVLRSGAGKEWAEERVNVLADYKRYFKTDEIPRPQGIAVLTDSDDTESRAQGEYARFRVCRS